MGRIIILGLVTLLVLAPAAARADELTLTIREHKFTPAEIKVPANKRLQLTVVNDDATPEEFESTKLNREKLIRGGHTVTIHLPALEPGIYEFFGEFNPKTAAGRLIVK